MRKCFFYCISVSMMVSLASCGNSSNGTSGNAEVNPVVETVETNTNNEPVVDEPITDEADDFADLKADFLREFYDNTFVKDRMFDCERRNLSHMSAKMKKMLRDQYDYDCEDGNCYAWWVFRDASQDTTGNIKVTVIHEDGDWFNVHYVDCETVDVKVRVEGGPQDFMITGIRNPAQGVSVQ